jgi:hypothetical protein
MEVDGPLRAPGMALDSQEKRPHMGPLPVGFFYTLAKQEGKLILQGKSPHILVPVVVLGVVTLLSWMFFAVPLSPRRAEDWEKLGTLLFFFSTMALIIFGAWFQYVRYQRKPFVFDRPTDRVSHGSEAICALSDIIHVRLSRREWAENVQTDSDYTYLVSLMTAGEVQAKESFEIGHSPEEAAEFARHLAEFMDVEVVRVGY